MSEVLELSRVSSAAKLRKLIPALVEAGLWSKEAYLREGDIPSFSTMLAEHMQGKGPLGKATALVIDAVVKHDLRNLY
jgi:uncharacterized protein